MKIIDTSVLIDFLRGKIDLPENSVLTVISYYELLWKALEKNAKEELKIIKRLFSFFPVLGIDVRVVEKTAEIKVKLKKKGKMINDFDLLIYGIGLVNGVEEIWTKDKDFKVIEREFPEIKIKLVRN